MSSFTGLLKVEFNLDGSRQRLLEPLIWEVDEIGSGKMVTIPAGHISNGVSVYWFLGWVFPRSGGRADRPARLHDYLIMLILDGYPHPHARSLRDAHEQFRIALLACGYSRLTARIAHLAVSVYSFFKWGNK